VRIRNLTNGTISNIVRFRIPGIPFAVVTSYPATLFVATPNPASQQMLLSWNLAGGENGIIVYRDGVNISGTLVAGTTTYTDTTISNDVMYEYCVMVTYAAGNARASDVQRVMRPTPTTSVSPSALTWQQISDTRIDFQWLLNSSVGTVTFNYRVRGSGSAFSTAALAAGTTTYSLAAAAGVEYEAYVTVSDAGATASNTVYTGQALTKTGSYK
jgi:hypothetical protein